MLPAAGIKTGHMCGADRWPYAALQPEEGPARMEHEFIDFTPPPHCCSALS
jgi:hypothetical protein